MEMGLFNLSWLLISVLLVLYSHLSSSFTTGIHPVRRLLYSPTGLEGVARWQTGIYAKLIRQDTSLDAAPGMLDRIVRARAQVATKRQTQTQTQTQTQSQAEMKGKKKKETLYQVVVYNDEIHTFEEARDYLYTNVPGLSEQTADQMTFAIDEAGQAVVTVLPKELAQRVSQSLQQAGLTSSIEPFTLVDKDDENE